MNLFGKKKAPPPKLSDTIQKLREALDTLDKREKHLEKQVQGAITEAKRKSKANDKRGALFQIKRKKLFEKQIDSIYGKKSNIEMQIMALEAAASNKDVVDAIAVGNAALEAAVAATNVDRVEDLMEKVNENIAMGDEVSDMVSQPIGPVMDEEILTKELEEMQKEMEDESLLDAPAVPSSSRVVVEADPEPVEPVVVAPAGAASRPAPRPAKRVVVMAGDAGSEPREERKSRPPKAADKEAADLADLEALMGMR